MAHYTHQWHITHTNGTLHIPMTHYTHQWHITHTNGTFPQSLTNFQRQAQYCNTFSPQHDTVSYQQCNIGTKYNSLTQLFIGISITVDTWVKCFDSYRVIFRPS